MWFTSRRFAKWYPYLILVLMVSGMCGWVGIRIAGSRQVEPHWQGKSLSYYLHDLKLHGPVNETPRKNTAEAFIGMGESMIPHLRKRLQSRDSAVLPLWMWIDEKIQIGDAPRLKSTPSWIQKKQALRAIPTLGYEARPLVSDLVSHLGDTELAYEAAWCLASMGHPGIDPLIGVLEDPESGVLERSAAVYGLGFLSSRRAIGNASGVLLAALWDDSDEVRKRTLVTIRTMEFIREKAHGRVADLADDANPAVSHEAMETLRRWGNQDRLIAPRIN